MSIMCRNVSTITDTASVYRNESDIGAAVASLLGRHKLSRSDLFITSKLGTATVSLSARLSFFMISTGCCAISYCEIRTVPLLFSHITYTVLAGT